MAGTRGSPVRHRDQWRDRLGGSPKIFMQIDQARPSGWRSGEHGMKRYYAFAHSQKATRRLFVLLNLDAICTLCYK